ncbi:acyl-CoA dehydrogenase family protein [Massilia sp. Se16.2.3]|uniref:acyl-CoA dehydrogenase family protein n=1 Tax=Massilia sp. Se16.2.3 TaxID=2709303 RepID=UPI0015FFE22E|nr:acyl-CoA dehydrogenase family protein [Massilia sp. Se16.2.3]QNA98601.1 monooxygenase [Massilia sp. Se16.2.3]
MPSLSSAVQATADATPAATAPQDPLALAAELAAQFALTAAERDRAGGHAAHERDLIRASGLLTLSIPSAFGGQGASWQTVLAAVRTLAASDSALAHVFGFHHLQLAGILLYGTAVQQRNLLGATVQQGLFWGNALNPLDKRTAARAIPGGFVLDGVKSFSSGSVGSDWLTVSAWVEEAGAALIGVLPTDQVGVRVEADWDAFGQRQTDSGNVHFDGVYLPSALVLQAPGQTPTPQSTLRSQVAQLIMTNLYLGIAEGAFGAARTWTLDHARPWFASSVGQSSDDPFVQHRYGEFWLKLRPALLLADEAARLLDAAFDQGAALSAQERGEVAVSVAAAKVLAHRAALDIGSEMFELTGARSTSNRFGFDRYWRNARVHTLHDPVDYKLRDLGRYALEGRLPEPTPYS